MSCNFWTLDGFFVVDVSTTRQLVCLYISWCFWPVTDWGILFTCLGISSKRREASCKKASTMTITITVPTIVRTWFLTVICSPTIRPTSVVHSLGSQTSSFTSRASHVRESSTKPLSITRHRGSNTRGTTHLYPFLFQIPSILISN